jgi:high-affinity iron transporter
VAVLSGLGLGTLAVLLAGWAVLGLGKRLPVGLLFKVTGALLALLSVVMTGAGMRGLQTAALLPATPVSWFPDSEVIQVWLGLFPVAEALAAQGAVLIVYVVAFIWARRLRGVPLRA